MNKNKVNPDDRGALTSSTLPENKKDNYTKKEKVTPPESNFGKKYEDIFDDNKKGGNLDSESDQFFKNIVEKMKLKKPSGSKIEPYSPAEIKALKISLLKGLDSL